jgi:diguanylate cyclase (GGDEF)-like protein
LIQQVKLEKLQAARQEILTQSQKVIQNERRVLEKLVAWDEVRQQLSNPSYYFFWHDERLPETEYWRPYYRFLAVYNANGENLGHYKDIQRLGPLPAKLTKQSLMSQDKAHFVKWNGQVYLILNDSVIEISSHKEIGYVVVAIDFLSALRAQHFMQADPDRIVWKMETPERFSLADLQKYLQFTPVENPVFTVLQKEVTDFVVHNILIVLFLIYLYWFIVKTMVIHPLNVLQKYLKALQEQPDRVVPPPETTFYYREYQQIMQRLSHYNRELVQQKNTILRQEAETKRIAQQDRLTGVANRMAFDLYLEELTDRCQSSSCQIGFLVVDCDFFKAINDTYGHAVGDQVIQHTAKVIQGAKTPCSKLFRIGGDEFAIVCSCKEVADLHQMAEKVMQALQQYDFSQLAEGLQVSFSMGGDYLPNAKPEDIETLQKHADMALFQSKQSLADKIHFYDQSVTNSEVLLSNNLISSVLGGLKTGEGIQMHIQPIVDAKEETCYYEGLIRIQTEEGLIFPDKIFPIVQHRHLEVELDRQVVIKVAELLKAGAIEQEKGISVNLSGATVVSQNLSVFLAPLIPLLKTYKIVVEVVEDVLIEYIDKVTPQLNQLRAMGFKISLDDFGSGYSSIRYLAKMPVDVVKFDRSLTLALLEDVQTAHIMKKTAQMIVEAGYELVMEGIEDDAHFQAAKAAGATYFQGYYWSKPYPALPSKAPLS